MKNIRFFTQLRVVILTAVIITFLMGLSQINLLTRLDDLGIYKFNQMDYFIRVVSIFCVSFVFLAANIFYNQINIGFIKLNLMKMSGILIFNLLLFIPLQFIMVIPRALEIATSPQRPDPESGNERILLWSTMASLVLMLISVLIGTVYRFMRDNYQIKLKYEMLQKESAEARFANLKEQLNPHFMFNSFSTLNGLIDEAPEKAKRFLHNMSDVYRYILNNDKIDVVPLADELAFSNRYLDMISERFGEAVLVKKQIKADQAAQKVPPLALQMLIENAVKHNNFNMDSPLQIHLYCKGDMLAVENNLNPRFIENTHSLGLHNLNQRYKYLSNQEIIIKKTEESFTVEIPLLP